MSIRIDFSQTIRSAEELMQVADDLERDAVRRFEQVLSTSRSAWSGDDYNAYRDKLTRELNQTRKHVKNIRSYASSVKRSAESLKRLEEKIVSLFS